MSQDRFDELSAMDVDARRRVLRNSETLPPGHRREAWLSGLSDPDWRVRREAVDAVVAHASDEPATIGALVDAALQGENVGLRNAALEALGRLGAPAVVALRERLRQTQGGERKFLIEALGESRARESVEDLVALCDDPDPNVAAAAVDALGRIGGAEAEQALRQRLASPDPFLRIAAVDALVRLGARLPFDEIAQVLEDRFLRRAVIPLLGRSGAVEAVPILAAQLDAGSAHVSAQAVLALHELLPSVGFEALDAQWTTSRSSAVRAQLRGTDERIRRAALVLTLASRDVDALDEVTLLAAEEALPPLAVEAFRRWGQAAVAPLLAVASRAAPKARAVALELAAELARARAPQPEVRSALLAALASDAPEVLAASLRGLSWHAAAEDAARVLALASHGEEIVRDAATAAIDALVARHPDAVVRAAAELPREELGRALPRVLARAAGAREELRAALTSGDPELRRACVEALGELGGEVPTDLLALSLTDEDPRVREAAATVLGRHRAGIPALLHALGAEEEVVEVRVAILGALAHGDGPEIDDVLVAQLEDDEPSVVVAALHGLATRRHPEVARHLAATLTRDDVELVVGALRMVRNFPREELRFEVERLLREHESWRVRAEAARALAHIAGTDRALRERVDEEPDERVRAALRSALSQVRAG